MDTRGLWVFAKRGGYSYGPLTVDRLQVFQLTGALNDEKLLRLGYVAELEKGPRGAQPECGICGSSVRFMDDASLQAHGIARHTDRTEAEQERFEEQRGRIEDQVAPLRMDRTAAELTGKAPAMPIAVGGGRRRKR